MYIHSVQLAMKLKHKLSLCKIPTKLKFWIQKDQPAFSLFLKWMTDWCEVQFRWLAFKKNKNKKTKTNKVLQNCYCLNYKTNERQLASVPKWFVSCCFLSLCKMVRASLWSRSGGKSSQVEYLLCICVDVTFGYLGFSYFIDKEMLNKFFMRVACAEMAFFF